MKTQNSIPLYHFNPSLCFIDDDPYLLSALTMNFSNSYHCYSFTSPIKALDFLQSYQSPLSNINFTGSHDHLDVHHADITTSYLNLKEISNLHKNPLRLNELTVLIVDQQMPEISGLELCQQIKHMPIKKLLLTADTNHHQAIDAFNANIIDMFINKGNEKLPKVLDAYVKQLNHKYFIDKTYSFLMHIESDKKKILSDPLFYDFLNTYHKENNICEYYLIDKSGSFLLLNNKQEISYIIVMTDEDIENFINLNQDSATPAVEDLLIQMSNHQLLPFFGIGKECWQVDMQLWRSYFYPAKQLVGRETYTYSIIKTPVFSIIEGGKGRQSLPVFHD